jgi:tRNA-dihydrouridine synthase A
MMDRTDRHMRFVMRCISRHTLLYTEMVTAHALLHGDAEHLLRYDAAEHPVVLQVGGDDPDALVHAAKLAEDAGYDEVNLNVGCPSDRVQKGCFGAVLMRTPDKVARAVEAMAEAVSIEVTVKHRIGVDELDRYEDMLHFVDVVSAAGCRRFTVHARKAWLQGLSPKQNRNIPPLRYPEVHRLKAERPHLDIEINGGIRTIDDTLEHLQHVDAVMIGRAACDTPWIFAEADRRVFGKAEVDPTREEVLEQVGAYLDREKVESVGRRGGFKQHRITRHLLNLFAGEAGTKAWKRVLATAPPDSGSEVLQQGLRAVEEAKERKAAFDATRQAS